MDAAIMDRPDLSAGSVAAVRNIGDPTQLARLVLGQSAHVMLVGQGATRFAELCGIGLVPDQYCITEDRVRQFNEVHLQGDTELTHADAAWQNDVDGHFGTIGAIARDVAGDLAAATSTGGFVNKHAGRVGDSPIIGAGFYTDNTTCTVSGAGHGEDFLRTVLYKTISDIIDHKVFDANQAAQADINYLMQKVQGRGGIIVTDKMENCFNRFTTTKMIRGWIENS